MGKPWNAVTASIRTLTGVIMGFPEKLMATYDPGLILDGSPLYSNTRFPLFVAQIETPTHARRNLIRNGKEKVWGITFQRKSF